MTIADAFKAELIAHMGEIVLALLAVLAAGSAWLVSWLRAHTTASAVRQAFDLAGGTPEAEQLAADELHRMPRLLRPGNVARAVQRAADRERGKRASVAPPADEGA